MPQLKLLSAEMGPVMTNCYLLINTDSKEALLFDAGAYPGSDREAKKIKADLEAEGASLKAIFLTHGHYDHIGGVNQLRELYPEVPIYIGENEKTFLGRTELNLSIEICGVPYTVDFEGENNHTIKDGEEVTVADLLIQAIEVPGHTVGGMCYYLPQANLVFDGDTLFQGSVGRSDFPTGDGQVLLDSIQAKLFTLPEETVVYPGHGPRTTIKSEKNFNMFF